MTKTDNASIATKNKQDQETINTTSAKNGK
jgi:hypothetical protein